MNALLSSTRAAAISFGKKCDGSVTQTLQLLNIYKKPNRRDELVFDKNNNMTNIIEMEDKPQDVLDTAIWFFKKLRERGRGREYLRPLDDMIRKMDTTATEENVRQLNEECINLIEKLMIKENEEFPREPDVILKADADETQAEAEAETA
jgi:hypothetical protein